MTTTRIQRSTDRSRLVVAIATGVLGMLLVAGGWQVGAWLQPDAADAGSARQVAYETAYADARSESFEAAYADAWKLAFERGAAAGRSEGDAAGVAAARAEIAAAKTAPPG